MSADDLVALAADCVVYMAAEPTEVSQRPGTDNWDSVDTMCQLLASGKVHQDVVATGISRADQPAGHSATMSTIACARRLNQAGPRSSAPASNRASCAMRWR